MLKKAIKRTGLAIIAVASITVAGIGLLTPAVHAAPIHLNPIPETKLAQDIEEVKFRGRHGFRGHRGGFRGGFRGHRGGFSKFSRGHRSGFRGHRGSFRKFNRGHGKSFRSRKFSRHGGFSRGHRFGGHRFRGHRFSRHGGFRFGGRRH